MEFLTREVAFNMYEKKIDDEKQAKELSVQKSKQPIFYTSRYFMWAPILSIYYLFLPMPDSKFWKEVKQNGNLPNKRDKTIRDAINRIFQQGTRFNDIYKSSE